MASVISAVWLLAADLMGPDFTLARTEPQKPKRGTTASYHCFICGVAHVSPSGLWWSLSISRETVSSPWQVCVGQIKPHPVSHEHLPGLASFLATRTETGGPFYVVGPSKAQVKSVVCHKEGQVRS